MTGLLQKDFYNLRTALKNILLIYAKLVDCLEKCLICRHIRRFAD